MLFVTSLKINASGRSRCEARAVSLTIQLVFDVLWAGTAHAAEAMDRSDTLIFDFTQATVKQRDGGRGWKRFRSPPMRHHC
jgi:hypothetical protein